MIINKKVFLGFLFIIFFAAGVWLANIWIGRIHIFSTKSPEFVINEYLLVGAPDISTDQLIYKFANEAQKKTLERSKAYKDYRSQVADDNNQLLKPFGYSLQDYQQYKYTDVHWYANLYRDNDLFQAKVDNMTPISVNTSKTDFIGFVDLSDGNRYLFTRDRFENISSFPQKQAYGYVGDQLLSMESVSSDPPKESIRVYLDDQLIDEFSMFPGNPVYASTNGPWTYDGHWALVLLDGKQDSQGNLEPATRVIVDGQDLNTVNHYEQPEHGFIYGFLQRLRDQIEE